MAIENAIIIINKTRLEQLNLRFNTKAQSKFYIEQSGGSFDDYEAEHNQFKKVLDDVQNITSQYLKYKIVEREFLPNFIFSDKDMIVVVGQDGLVANTAKYAKGLPILAVNPDTNRFDGVLLPFDIYSFETGLRTLVEEKANFKPVTMAEASLNNGQKLLAFNDFFIGPSSHISARYKISYQSKTENHSSSGIIISTGAGSTGWISSLINMSNGIEKAFSSSKGSADIKMSWGDNRLVFMVREPFKSKYSQTNITAGFISQKSTLKLESLMPTNGVIFSDGIEKDYLQFNAGAIVEIGLASQKAMIVENDELRKRRSSKFSKLLKVKR